MSHITGTVQVLNQPLKIVPGTKTFKPAAAPGGTKLLILHFQNPAFLPGDKLKVKLGYATDTFTAADGPSFWTRPIDVYAFPTGVEITYEAAGPATGGIELDRYGRGERHVGEPGHPSFSNSDPFYQPPAYLEPSYDPWWYCVEPPNWENVASVTDPLDVRARVARSVGMIVSVEVNSSGETVLSTCSVTLVDADKVITAGHCHTPSEALASSVIFNYETLADGTRPPGYQPHFYKVKAVLGHANVGALDYSLLQLAEAPPGIPAIQMRHDLPTVGESVFGVHHPNGAVKKLSLPHVAGFSKVTASSPSAVEVPKDFHISGGSSGSGLFDGAGRIVGVLSSGDPCGKTQSPFSLVYCPTPIVLADLEPSPPSPTTRDVMVVFDRSGSMTMDDGTGRTKIEAARDAVSLFVQLVRANAGNRLGLVSFSTTASQPVDFAIAAVTPTNKKKLTGPAPFTTGIVGALSPGGTTAIGLGLDAARAQFPLAGPNPRAILLLTDGLQNEPPWVHEIEPALNGITVHAIGFGAESSLDGVLLTGLTTLHGGLYMRAGGGLALEKFFANAFGNIFEAGVIFDPETDLPADSNGAPIPFSVCGESALVAVTGWDDPSTDLFLEVRTPGGKVLKSGVPGVESAKGRTWAYLRISLPIGGERDGSWSVRVVRPTGGGEFPPPTPALRYFVNVIPSGGPHMLREPDDRRYYTGDVINPVVLVRHGDGGWPAPMDVRLTVTRPDTGVGNVLSESGLTAPGSLDGDTIPARNASLLAIEAARGTPVARYTDTDFELSDESEHNRGRFEGGGTFGRSLEDLLIVEGNYTFHARAAYGESCRGTRELVWTLHVEVGIDGDRTIVTSTPLDPGPGGRPCVRLTVTPRDRYGNRLGPGRADAFDLGPGAGATLSSPVVDLGAGSYQVDVCGDPDSVDPPTVVLTQPGRPPVVVGPPASRRLVYSVKFLCGTQGADCCGCEPVASGRYATEINIHNPTARPAGVVLRAIALVTGGAVVGREPDVAGPGKVTTLRLPAHSATMVDCCRLTRMVRNADPTGPPPLSLGILEIVSQVELEVTAVYTAGDGAGGTPSIDVQKVSARPATASIDVQKLFARPATSETSTEEKHA